VFLPVGALQQKEGGGAHPSVEGGNLGNKGNPKREAIEFGGLGWGFKLGKQKRATSKKGLGVHGQNKIFRIKERNTGGDKKGSGERD